MKKVAIVALFSFLGLTQVNAQVSFKPGIRSGLNFAHFSKCNNDYYNDSFNSNNRDFSSATDFYIGLFGDLKLTKYYSLQPEINYSRQGSNYTYYDGALMSDITKKLEVSNLIFGIANKFTFNKFNVHVGPTIEFLVDQNFDTDTSVDLAFFLGAGYDITTKFGIEARVKKKELFQY